MKKDPNEILGKFKRSVNSCIFVSKFEIDDKTDKACREFPEDYDFYLNELIISKRMEKEKIHLESIEDFVGKVDSSSYSPEEKATIGKVADLHAQTEVNEALAKAEAKEKRKPSRMLIGLFSAAAGAFLGQQCNGDGAAEKPMSIEKPVKEIRVLPPLQRADIMPMPW